MNGRINLAKIKKLRGNKKMNTTNKVMKILHLESEIELQKSIIKNSYNDYGIERAYFKLDYLPEELEKLEKALSNAEIDALNYERKIKEQQKMKTVKEFFNKLELENSNIEIEYNDMDIIIFKDSSMVGQIVLYNFDNDCEDTDKNIELPFEYLTTSIMKFRNASCVREAILSSASDSEIMEGLIYMEII